MHTRHTMRAGPDYGERERGRPRDSRATDRAGADPRLPRWTLRGRPSATQGWRVRLPQVCRSGQRRNGSARGSGRLARARAAVGPPPASLAIRQSRAGEYAAPSRRRRRRRGARGSGRIYIKAMFCVSNFEMTSRFP